MMRLPFNNMQYHSLAVGCRKRCDETNFHKMWNATHSLLVIGKDVMRLPLSSQNMKYHSLPVVIGKDMMRLPFSQNVQCHPQTVGHRKRCDETNFHQVCNVTHLLLVIGKNVMRLLSESVHQMSLTSCGSWKRCDEIDLWKMCNLCHSLAVKKGDEIAQNMQCHSLAVGHRKKWMR